MRYKNKRIIYWLFVTIGYILLFPFMVFIDFLSWLSDKSEIGFWEHVKDHWDY